MNRADSKQRFQSKRFRWVFHHAVQCPPQAGVPVPPSTFCCAAANSVQLQPDPHQSHLPCLALAHGTPLSLEHLLSGRGCRSLYSCFHCVFSGSFASILGLCYVFKSPLESNPNRECELLCTAPSQEVNNRVDTAVHTGERERDVKDKNRKIKQS